MLSETAIESAGATARADAVVLGIDFGGSKIAACACTPSGELLSSEVVQTTPSLGAEDNFHRGVALASRLAAGADVRAVGACTFGIPGEHGVTLSPAISGWDSLPLRRRLEEAFGAPASVATDVKVAAAAEARHGALVGCDPAIYLNLGTGLAVAFVVGGVVVRGAHGASGEIGYNLLRLGGPGDRRDEHGPKGPFRGARVLEDVVSGMGLARAAAALEDGDARPAQAGSRGRTTEDAARVAALLDVRPTDSDLSDPGGGRERIVADFLDELCFHMVNLTVALDPDRIAVGGGLARAWERIGAPIRRALDEHVPFPPDVVLGAYPFDAALRGAADLALDLARERADGAASGSAAWPGPGLRASQNASTAAG